jgi:pimeloyl-ACP methyl ester carboxylesterase
MQVAPRTITAEEALDLWLRPPRLPISRRERRLLDKARTSSLHFTSPVRPTGDFDLPMSAWGEEHRPLILLMHGWGGHRGQLVGFVEPLLAAGYRVAAFDAPGHGDVSGDQASGYQMAKAMQAVLRQVGPPTAILAHSFGSMAVTVALQEGLKVNRLVFFGPTRRLEDVVDPFLKMNGLSADLGEEMRRLTERSWGEDVWQRTALDIQLPKFDIPALVVHDREDETTPYLSGVAVARAWPSAKMITTRGLGHRGPLKDPDVIRQVVAFLSAD